MEERGRGRGGGGGGGGGREGGREAGREGGRVREGRREGTTLSSCRAMHSTMYMFFVSVTQYLLHHIVNPGLTFLNLTLLQTQEAASMSHTHMHINMYTYMCMYITLTHCISVTYCGITESTRNMGAHCGIHVHMCTYNVYTSTRITWHN